MANPQRGQFDFEAGGTAYTLRYSIDALCALEERFDKNIANLALEISDFDKIRLATVRAVLWAGLTEHQPDMTEHDCNAIFEALGLMPVAEIVLRGVEASFPKRGEEAAPANPPIKAPPPGPGLNS